MDKITLIALLITSSIPRCVWGFRDCSCKHIYQRLEEHILKRRLWGTPNFSRQLATRLAVTSRIRLWWWERSLGIYLTGLTRWYRMHRSMCTGRLSRWCCPVGTTVKLKANIRGHSSQRRISLVLLATSHGTITSTTMLLVSCSLVRSLLHTLSTATPT